MSHAHMSHVYIYASELLREMYATNVIGVTMTTQACLSALHEAAKLEQSPIVINMAAGMMALSRPGMGFLSYRLSKAALNMLTVTMAQEQKSEWDMAARWMWMCVMMS